MALVESDELLELCPVCEGELESCAWCDGTGLVEHDCPAGASE